MGHWQNDLWRPAFGGGVGDVNYDFYGIGNSRATQDTPIAINQQAVFGLAQLMRRWLPGFYAGLRLTASHTKGSSAGLDEVTVEVPPLDFSVTAYAAALIAQWDTRDNQFYPTAGQYANLSASFQNGDDPYQIYKFDWNAYHAFGDNAVIAVRLFLRSTDGDAPFYALSSFGQHNDLRGYKSGKYRDNDQFTTQVEYRQKLGARWGFVVFAGVGEVAPSFGDMTADNLLPSVGAGLRFRVADSHPVNLRFDWAYGDESSFYLGVGEAF
jgi:outer membrane protein assembly factor BamA